MARRRTTIREELADKVSNISWNESTEKFLDSLKLKGLAYHTRRWHKENLLVVFKALKNSNYATEPSMITENMLKDVLIQPKIPSIIIPTQVHLS